MPDVFKAQICYTFNTISWITSLINNLEFDGYFALISEVQYKSSHYYIKQSYLMIMKIIYK
jgi:hypothetical protein